MIFSPGNLDSTGGKGSFKTTTELMIGVLSDNNEVPRVFAGMKL